jgi:hypothetical protein
VWFEILSSQGIFRPDNRYSRTLENFGQTVLNFSLSRLFDDGATSQNEASTREKVAAGKKMQALGRERERDDNYNKRKKKARLLTVNIINAAIFVCCCSHTLIIRCIVETLLTVCEESV